MLKYKSKKNAITYFGIIAFIFRDLEWIQTINLLSRNQVRYSVAPRGRFEGANILFFAYLQTIFCNKISPTNNCKLPFFGFSHIQPLFSETWKQDFIDFSENFKQLSFH